MNRQADALHERAADMAVILDHISCGLMIAQLDGSIGETCSRALRDWFGQPAPGALVWDYLAGGDAGLASWIQLAFDSLRDPASERELALTQLPRQLERDGRHYRVEYRPLGEPLTGFLIVASDVTDDVARQHGEAAQRELLSIVERARTDRAGVAAFVHDGDELVRHGERTSAPPDELVRRLHTLKGNALLLGAATIAEACHALETAIEADGQIPDRAGWTALRTAWHALRERLDRVLDTSEHQPIIVDWDEYQAVVAQLGPEPLAARIRRWADDRARSHLQRFASHARELAHQLGKAELDVEVRDNDVRIDGEQLAPVWSALVHAVTNAIDHGIERAADRRAAGKPERAKMTLVSELRGGELVIEIRDDGAGIDWQSIARRAAELGLPATTPRELSDALFAPGLSTAHEITQLSGRGVGMAALQAACGELGGEAFVLSELGRGTTVRCVLPIARPKPSASTKYYRAACSPGR